MDFAGHFQGRKYLLLVDAHTKWPEGFFHLLTAYHKSATHLFAMYGLSLQLVSVIICQFSYILVHREAIIYSFPP